MTTTTPTKHIPYITARVIGDEIGHQTGDDNADVRAAAERIRDELAEYLDRIDPLFDREAFLAEVARVVREVQAELSW